jgi:hypothetical protein
MPLVQKANLGQNRDQIMPGFIIGMITTPTNFKISSANLQSDTLIQASLQALINAPSKSNRGYFWPLFKKVDNISKESVYDENLLGKIPVYDGVYNFKCYLYEGIAFHDTIWTHRGGNMRVFLLDNQNLIWGMDDDTGGFQGYTVGNINTEKLNISDGKNASYSVIDLSLSNNLELDRDGIAYSAKNVGFLTRLAELNVAQIGNTTATAMVIKVTTQDGIGLTGLVAADFILNTAAGVAVTITSATPVATNQGAYTLAGTTFAATNVLTLRPVGSFSISGYEYSYALAIV